MMDKRRFISTGMVFLSGVAGMLARSANADTIATKRIEQGEVILSVTGAIDHPNRAKFDPVSDQLMHKHGVKFDRAHQFTLNDLLKLPAVTIHPTMEYDQRNHTLTGPRLLDVLNVAGVDDSKVSSIVLRGIDGYSPQADWNEVKQLNFILATHLDGQLLHIGGFGPLFAIYDADRIAEFAAKPVDQRFQLCPWGLYCIEVA